MRAPESVARYDAEHRDLSEMRIVAVDEFPNWLILFRVTATAVEILRIVHGAKDIPGMSDEILPD